MTRPRLTTVVGLLLTLGAGSLPYPVWLDELAGTRQMIATELVYWGLVAATLLFVRGVERRSLASIGVRAPRCRDWLAGLLVATLVVAALTAVYLFVFPAAGVDESGAIDRLRAAPAWWLAASVVRAGASEEVLFRAYPIERLREWTGSPAIAAGLPLTLFTLAHAPSWGLPHMLVAGVGGGLLTWLWLWRRNLWVSVAAHCLVDGIAMVAG